jgi:hypothetical protein
MWLVRKSSGEPVYFQCAVLPLEDYPSRSVTYDASALPGSTSAETPAIEAQAAATGVNALLEQKPAAPAENEAAKKGKVPASKRAGAAVAASGQQEATAEFAAGEAVQGAITD